jgi:hypothetical protein
MDKYEAIEAMKAGLKVRHRYFDPKEWVAIAPDGNYIFEDGVTCKPSIFWFDRSQDYWNTDWEIYKGNK